MQKQNMSIKELEDRLEKLPNNETGSNTIHLKIYRWH